MLYKTFLIIKFFGIFFLFFSILSISLFSFVSFFTFSLNPNLAVSFGSFLKYKIVYGITELFSIVALGFGFYENDDKFDYNN